jgi:hypothetical protein
VKINSLPYQRPIRRLSAIAIAQIGLLAATAVLAADDAKKPEVAKARPAAREPSPALKPITDDPKLPRVLLIGDSISIGYTLPVRELLQGKMNVHRPPTNCGHTAKGLKELDKWLGSGKWDVIHFNWGLHDLNFVDDKKQPTDSAEGRHVVPPEQYEKNLRELVARLKKSGAKLIWATITPVPDGIVGRKLGSEARYNEIAARVMKENGVAIDDLNAIVKKDPAGQLPHNVHFSQQGSRELAKAVVASIEAALAKYARRPLPTSHHGETERGGCHSTSDQHCF